MPFKSKKSLQKSTKNCEVLPEEKPSKARSNISVDEKKVIYKVINYFENYRDTSHEIQPNQVIKNAAEASGVSESTIRKVKREKNLNCDIRDPILRSGRPHIYIDPFLLGVIRRTVHGFYVDKKYPTVSEVLLAMKREHDDLPNICENTLRSILISINFHFKKFNSRAVCFESPRIVDQRTKFLRLIKKLRSQGYIIWYTDETWCGANHSPKLDPFRLDFEPGKVQEIDGFKGGIVKPSGAGKRTIILDIGNEEGFLEPREETSLCFEGKKDSNDYHNEMCGEHYLEWFSSVLRKIPEHSVIVIDQAPYHTMRDPQSINPTMAWRKDAIIDWLVKHEIQPTIEQTGHQDEYNELTKTELIELGRPKFKPFKYLLETKIEECGKDVKILWLPVAHCELNAIELIWAYVKAAVAKENGTFKIKYVVELCKKKLREVPQELWMKAVLNARKREDDYRKRDRVIDMEIMHDVIVNLESDSSNDDYD
ncbi:hypothetical protein B566_EDAN015122 [Ephemera danica]|nr:hypothetical protein B566_EDAN015122 [Ephemera danica]